MQTPETVVDLSVIIVNWNAREYLEKCLETVFASNGDVQSLEVWVVDNASTDDSAELVRLGFPNAHLIVNTTNRGFAAANNQALAQAGGRYAILLNPDTEAPPGALAELVRFLDTHPRAGVVGPRLAQRQNKIQGGAAGYDPSPWTLFNYSFFLYKLSLRLFRSLWLSRRQYLMPGPIRVDWVSGAALMVRTEAVRATGGLHEGYFMYAEDMDWCRRIRAAGWEVYCQPEVQITHHIGRSVQQQPRSFFGLNVDSLDLYYRRLYGPAMVRLLHLIGTGGFLLRAVGYEAMYLVRGEAAYAELRDQWVSCLRASVGHLFGKSPEPVAQAGVTTLETRPEARK